MGHTFICRKIIRKDIGTQMKEHAHDLKKDSTFQVTRNWIVNTLLLFTSFCLFFFGFFLQRLDVITKQLQIVDLESLRCAGKSLVYISVTRFNGYQSSVINHIISSILFWGWAFLSFKKQTKIKTNQKTNKKTNKQITVEMNDASSCTEVI